MTNMNTLLDGVDRVANKDDRWLFLLSAALIVVGCAVAIRYLAAQQRRYEDKLETIVQDQSDRSKELAVCISANTEVLRGCSAELQAAAADRKARRA